LKAISSQAVLITNAQFKEIAVRQAGMKKPRDA